MACPSDNELVEPRIDKVLTQYRESPNLLATIRAYLRQAEMVAQAVCDLPARFDIDSAVGDQLTLLGKRMGWPRCHCVCDVQTVFGFECEGVVSEYPIAGLCGDGVSWIDCGDKGRGEVCIVDDELYRRFLKTRSYQMERLYVLDNLAAAVRELFGDTATVLDAGVGRVVIAPGREITREEQAVLQLFPRVIPVAPGIEIRFHFGELSASVFGFGDGWGGFCELAEPDGLSLATEDDVDITTADDVAVTTGPLTYDAPWMCEIDLHPYECV